MLKGLYSLIVGRGPFFILQHMKDGGLPSAPVVTTYCRLSESKERPSSRSNSNGRWAVDHPVIQTLADE